MTIVCGLSILNQAKCVVCCLNVLCIHTIYVVLLAVIVLPLMHSAQHFMPVSDFAKIATRGLGRSVDHIWSSANDPVLVIAAFPRTARPVEQ